MAGGINRPVLPTTGTTSDEQRLRSGLGAIVRSVLDSGAFLNRLFPGKTQSVVVGTGTQVQLAWGDMNRLPPTDVVVAFLPKVTAKQIGVPLVISKAYATGVAMVQPAGVGLDGRTQPTVDGLATGFQMSEAGQRTLMTDGTNWFSQGGGSTVNITTASGVFPTPATFRLPPTHNPVAQYHFDGTLNDSSGNGLHLSVEAGDNYFAPIFPGVMGAMIGGNAGAVFSRLVCNASLAATMLALKDDISIEMIAVQQEHPTADVSGFGPAFADAGATEASNALWQFNASAVNGPQWFSRHGAAISDTAKASGMVYPPPASRPILVGARRASGIIRFFLDGKPLGTLIASGLVRPTGGTLCKLRFGGSNSGTQGTRYLSSGCKIMPTGISDEAFLEDFNASLGTYYGTQF